MGPRCEDDGARDLSLFGFIYRGYDSGNYFTDISPIKEFVRTEMAAIWIPWSMEGQLWTRCIKAGFFEGLPKQAGQLFPVS